ncbi:MAG TPA: aldo/keto reductase [Clostridia bacterium]|nr:aldo/keto reductase [Clostridia bacterium]
MKRVLLTNTDMHVSPLCIGTVNYGTSIDPKDAKTQLDAYVELGGNFIDTAHVYGDWVPGPRGRSEKVIGQWLNETGLRENVIISTKGAHPDISDVNVSRVNPEAIEKDLNESLERLKTDYIDLYFLHRDNPNVPVVEVLDALEKARTAGKIRYYGCSNWSLSRIIEASNYAKEQNISGFVCNQLMWSLADVNYKGIEDKTLVLMDEDTYEYHKETGLNAMAYTAVAKGYFSKLQRGESVSEKISSRYDTPSNQQIFDEIVKTASRLNADIIQVELAFLMHQDFASIPIVSFSSLEQLEQAMKSCELELDEGTISKLRSMKNYVIE